MKVLAVSIASARGVLHQKVLYGVLIFATALIIASVALTQLTVGQWERLITDIGVSAIGFSCSLVAVFMGAGTIASEVDKKTIYFVLSKPFGRMPYVLSRYLGLLGVLVINAVAMFALTSVVLLANQFNPTGQMAAAALGSLLEAAVLAALAVGFSCFTTPALAAASTLAIFIAGHIVSQVNFFTRGVHPIIRAIGWFMVRFLPDFSLMNFKAHAVDKLELTAREVGSASAYGLGYAGVVLILAMALFTQRDLK